MYIKKVLFIALMAGMSIAMFAQATDTADITLTGSVQAKVEVTVTAESGASNLDLTVNQTDLKVATVTEYCNIAAGYSMTLSTSSASATPSFTKTSDTSKELEYTVKYDGDAVTFDSTGLATIVDGASQTTSGAISKDLTISYSGAASNDLTSGSDYVDTLVFTITAGS